LFFKLSINSSLNEFAENETFLKGSWRFRRGNKDIKRLVSLKKSKILKF
jgi:hypothetical protein